MGANNRDTNDKGLGALSRPEARFFYASVWAARKAVTQFSCQQLVGRLGGSGVLAAPIAAQGEISPCLRG